ncbi:sensor histidine kinase [Fenollaria sporofastidiosus]|uniref:sensor histidine kinase n=1 Tax=Fenollaria sporofastidiosus TaxID=2811778 RepID=UPI00203D487D|nr:sensor histidine kinase [Fenollaria sporofastidiosus]
MMRIFELNSSEISIIFAICMVLLAISLRLMIELMDIKPRSAAFASSVFLVLVNLFLVQILAELGSRRMLISKPFLNLWVSNFTSYLFGIALAQIDLFFRLRRIRKSQIGKNSIKESMDNLPDGLCFSKLDGTPTLVNRQMQMISYEVFGKHLINDLTCARLARECKVSDSTQILQKDPLVMGACGKIWLYQIIEDKEKKYRETIAYNITEEWGVLGEIKKKNKEIKAANKRLKDYQDTALEYTRQKEILRSKIKIHDKIAQSLIYFRHYLDKQDKNEDERKRLVQLWNESLVVLDEGEDEEVKDALWKKLLETAESIGIGFHFTGSLPEGENDKNTFISIVHKALNNAIRHAEAKNVWIDINEDGLRINLTIKNDGHKPSSEIKEKGGLKNIRARLKIYGGKMSIDTSEVFTLRISWLKGENYDL